MKDLNDSRKKIKSPKELAKTLKKLRAHGKKITYSHGVFDVFHHGHLYHLEQAKKHGDILVVSLTADKYVNKGPSRPVFTIAERMKVIASLGIVDFVTPSNWPYPLKLMKLIKPDFYIKGKDSTRKMTDGLRREMELIKKMGGRVIFTNSLPIHSTELVDLLRPPAT